ncbi:GDP-mannose mannosyl hydrolase [Pseudomonas sp. LFM046]|uniref:GDP-mannose mannosyl hydrolase n=1 Tax=Pseudomonas sp. LFM046 TaxID=1608357 RepID=UPI0005CFE316|nr:GDP-mannose mannosyl hydrolase [Pseudomonas sp. LFM046]
MWLSNETFRTVVASAPLVSIDLVVKNEGGEVLLGQRLNRPAQGFWFVPGGRILKGESLDEAFRRLTFGELGRLFERSEGNFLGIFEHFYKDSVFGAGETGPDTHYVVLAYQLILSGDVVLSLPDTQHGEYGWWNLLEMQSSAEVHENTRAYLRVLR